MTAKSSIPYDVLRAVGCLFGIAALAVVVAGVYQVPYLFEDPFGNGLPDVNVGAGTLTLGLQLGAVSAVLWALALSTFATPASASALRAAGNRWVEAEDRRPHIVVLALAVAVLYAVARGLANQETMHATMEAYTAGEAKTPFQYRALVPWIVRALTDAVPVSLPWAYGLVEAAAAFGVYLAFYLLLRSFFESAALCRLAALAVFLPLALNLATPHRYNAILFPYDTPSVAFFALGLALLLRREWWAYYPLFIVATLNRETTCFLAVGYLFMALGRDRTTHIAMHVAAQAVLWIGVKYGLHTLYAGNDVLGIATGGLFSNQIARSGRILTAVPGLLYMLLVTMGGAGAVVLLLWRRVRDARVRRLFAIVPFFFVGMIVVGELLEVRIYSELIPLVTLALLLILRSVVLEASEQTLEAAQRDLAPA